MLNESRVLTAAIKKLFFVLLNYFVLMDLLFHNIKLLWFAVNYGGGALAKMSICLIISIIFTLR